MNRWLWLVLTGVLALQGQEPTSSVNGRLWLAEASGVLGIGLESGAVETDIPHSSNVRAVGVDPARELVWSFAGGIASAIDTTGSVLTSIGTGASSNSDAAMVVHHGDGHVWVAVDKDLFLIGSGSILAQTRLGASYKGIGLDKDSNQVWVGQNKEALAFDHVTGQAAGEVAAPKGTIRDLDVDADGRLWIATSTGLYAGVTFGDPGVEISTTRYDHVRTRASGGAWAVAGPEVTAFAETGAVEWTVPLFQGVGQVEDLVEDQATGNLWVANPTAVVEVDPSGVELRYLLLDPTPRIWRLAIAADVGPPSIGIVSPQSGISINDAFPDFELEYSDPDGVDPASIELQVDDVPAESNCTANEAQATCTLVDPIDEGEHTIEATIRDFIGNMSDPALVTITIDLTSPQLFVTAPEDGLITNSPTSIALTGSISEQGTVELNGVPVTVETDLTFNHSPLALAEGSNALSVIATDQAGNQTSLELTVTVDTVAPAAVDTQLVSTSLVADNATITGATAAAEAGTTLQATNTRTGETASAAVAGDGSFSATLPAIDDDLVELIVVDPAGNASSAVTVVLSATTNWSCNQPPDPSSIAPVVDTTVSYDMFEANRFLWEAATPVQAGVAPDAISSERIILLRGRVLDEAGEPLPGVKVTIKDHPELGCTSTRADGRFDLAANGGGAIIVRFEQDGYFSVDRREETFGRQYYHLDDVVMTQIPEESHQVALGQGTAQFFSAPTVTDAAGSRATAFVVPAGTDAVLRFDDGTTQPVSSLSVRVNEYTVGENGPEAMPAALPPTSGYTYAFEATADEALATGAVSVDFSQPLFHYVENFLDFPVGEYVPTGYYDKQAGAWVASGNGIVVRILSVDGEGRAVLDFDGDGVAEDATFLLENEVTDGELLLVGAQYSVGQTLWRVPIPHFTPYDCNWPYGPPEDAEPPAEDAADEDSDPNENDCELGSVIDCQSQNLRERVPIVGTPYALHYNSALTTGKKSNRRIKVRLIDESTPASVEFIQISVEIAGQHMSTAFGMINAPEEWSYEWDGFDQLGRPVIGEAIATVKVGYGYIPVYRSAWRESSVSTGGGGGGGSGDGVSSLLSFGRMPSTFELIGTRGDSAKIILQRTYKKTLRNFDAQSRGLGGWTLDRHQFLDRTTHTLVGNGQIATADDITNQETLVDRSGATVFVWNNGAWEPTELSSLFPTEIESLRTGEVLFTSGNRIIRRTLAGDLYHIAGASTSPPFQDGRYLWEDEGVLAMHARMGRVTSLREAANGVLFVASDITSRVFRVDQDGRAYLVAGNGDSDDYSGDGGPATEAGIGEPIGLTVGPDGALYIAHKYRLPSGTGGGWALAIRRVDLVSGVISTFAGGGTEGCRDFGPSLEGKLAYGACIWHQWTGRFYTGGIDIAFDQTGGLLFPQASGSNVADSYIWRIRPSGLIERFAGGDSAGYSGDGGPANEAQIFRPVGVERMGDSILIVPYSAHSLARVREVQPDGTISTLMHDYIDAVSTDYSGRNAHYHFNRRLFSGDQVAVVGLKAGYGSHPAGIGAPSSDGRRLHIFDAAGRALETVDTLTSTPIARFFYGSDGLLSAVEDRDGDRMTVTRSGSSIELKSPDGVSTTLTLDASGFASTIRNSAGESWQFDYSSDGLMTSMTSPRGGGWLFDYDEDGRLIRDTDPEGGFKQLIRTQNGRPYTVGVTTAGGRTTSYNVIPVGDGTEQRTNTTGDLVEDRALLKHSAGAVETPDGTFVNVATSPDPRFGTASPFASSVTVDTPSGRTRQVTRSRSSTLLGDQFTETVTLNGRMLTSQYDGSSNTHTTTTPEGRMLTTQLNDLGRVESIEVGGLAPIQFGYNAQGKLSSVSSTADGVTRSASFGYGTGGWLESATDPLGRTTNWARDPVGRATSQALPDGRTIGFEYDANGNPTSLTPPGRPAHSFSYSLVDQATGYDPPGSPAASYSYDLDRRLTGISFPAGGPVNLTHDTENRLLSVDTNDDDLTLTYVPGTTHVAGISRSNGQSNAYTYDGFLPLSQSWSGVVSGNVSYDYDTDFRIDSLSVNATPIAYGYDGDSLLTQAGALTASRDSANGLLTGTSLDMISTTWSYNGFGESVTYEATDSTNTLFREEMDRDLLGRVTQKRETFGTTTTVTDYGYDETGRLVWVDIDGARAVTWTYDSNDNRLTEVTSSGTTSGTYDDQDRLLSYGNTTYTWNDGDLVTRTTNTFVETFDYDAFGNLVTYSSPSIDIEYVVDGQNRRVGKRINGTLVRGFLYAEQLNPVAELDGSGGVVSTFIYGTRPNTPDYMVKYGVTYRVISDHLGSVRLVVNSADGTIAQRMDYDAWGNVVYDSNPGFQPFGFAGGIHDRHTGLTRFGARDYDPQTGRWTAKDPILFAGGDTNLYRYAAGDPVNLVDPDGLEVFILGKTPAFIRPNPAWRLAPRLPVPPRLPGRGPKVTKPRPLLPDEMCRQFPPLDQPPPIEIFRPPPWWLRLLRRVIDPLDEIDFDSTPTPTRYPAPREPTINPVTGAVTWYA